MPRRILRPRSVRASLTFLVAGLVAGLGACAATPPPPPARTVAVAPPAAPVADEDRPENPSPAWIVADWSVTPRALRSRLLVEVRRAEAWSRSCSARHQRLASAVSTRRSAIDASLARVDAMTNPYDALVEFRAVFDDARWAEGLGMDPWERARFGDPLDAYVAGRLVAWERTRSPKLVGAVAVRPLGRSSFAFGSSALSEAMYCRHARDAGVPGIAAFVVAPELRRLMRAPFEDSPPEGPPLSDPSPFTVTSPTYFVEGIVQSVSSTPTGTTARLLHRYQFIERRPPCYPAPCQGMDCGMGPHPMICNDVTVTKQDVFDVVFAALPTGVTLQKGDSLSLQAEEDPDVSRATFHAVILDWVDRGVGGTRVWSLDRPSAPPPR